jgi:hypothetical protein
MKLTIFSVVNLLFLITGIRVYPLLKRRKRVEITIVTFVDVVSHERDKMNQICCSGKLN